MLLKTTSTVLLMIISMLFAACSGSGKQKAASKMPASNAQKNSKETSLPSGDISTNQSSQTTADQTKGSFIFQINGEDYTATSTNPSMYSDVSDTSSVLGLTATDKEATDQGTAMTISLSLKKGGLKTGSYPLGDAEKDATPYKATYIKKTKDGVMYLGTSQKGTCTITDYQKVSDREGKVSGHFSFTGTVVLTTTLADNPPEKPFTAKGEFHDISLEEYHKQ